MAVFRYYIYIYREIDELINLLSIPGNFVEWEDNSENTVKWRGWSKASNHCCFFIWFTYSTDKADTLWKVCQMKLRTQIDTIIQLRFSEFTVNHE